MNRLLDVLARVWQAITRERAVITGLVLAVLEAVERGEITKATAVPVIAGILGIITAFDIGHLSADQTAAVGAVLSIVAAAVAQRFTTPVANIREHH